MAASPSPLVQPIPPRNSVPHLHLADDEVCPLCDQPIPHDRYDEIKARIDEREQARESEISARLGEQFERQKAQIVEQAQHDTQAALERAAQESQEKITAAAEEARKLAETTAQERLTEAHRISQEAQTALQTQLQQAETQRGTLEAQIETVRRESASAIETVKQEAAAKEANIRADAARAADAAVQVKLASLAKEREDAEAALQVRIAQAEADKTAAQDAGMVLRAQLEEAERDKTATIEKMQQDAVAREAEIRREVQAAAEAATQQTVAGLTQAKTEAEAKVAAAEQQMQTLQAGFDTQLAERLQEQRAALEQAKTEAVNAEKAAIFDEKLKLSNKVEELQRALDKKTAEELGEAAELDLFEALKAEYEGDRIERVNKGLPGADILHTVIHNGRECGRIIYDSKNHKAWRNEFVTKLAADQMAAPAEHAVLSTRKFPAGTQHLHIQDGVILASPARVLALVQILRDHLVQTTKLRLSNEARTQKTAALYSFITSERCRNFFAQIDKQAQKLLDLQLKEQKTHQDVWKNQGIMLRSIQKLGGDLSREIETIIGSADAPEVTP